MILDERILLLLTFFFGFFLLLLKSSSMLLDCECIFCIEFSETNGQDVYEQRGDW